MARIRTIKPDFWTDEKIVELDFAARLFFVGSWNFADDNGNLQRSAKKLKMQIFPADAIDCEPVIQSLLTHGLLSEYEVNGEKFLHINGFRKHQVINRPSKTGLPTPESATTPVTLTDGSVTEGKGMEEEGKGIGKEEQQHNHCPQSRAAEGSIERHVQVAILLRGLGVSPITPMHPAARELAETGASDEQLRAAVDVARERKPAPEAISPNYLRPILAEILNPPKPRAPKAPPLHAMTDTQLNAEGKRCGAGEARIGETRHDYIGRIQTAQAIAQGRVAA